MQIIGFNFDKISAEKKKAPSGKVEIKSNLDIKDIGPEKIDLVKDKDVIRFNFTFSVDYFPGIANVSFEGTILAIVEKEQAKEIIKKWKSKKIPDDTRLALFNLILTKCNLRSLQLEEELGLPTHVPMPKVSLQDNKQGYVQ